MNEDLKAQFRNLREAEQRRAPSFERTLTKRTAKPLLRWSLAAAAVAGALVVVMQTETVEEEVSSLAAWEAPTEVLLEPWLEEELYEKLPTVTPVVPDYSDAMEQFEEGA